MLLSQRELEETQPLSCLDYCCTLSSWSSTGGSTESHAAAERNGAHEDKHDERERMQDEPEAATLPGAAMRTPHGL